MSTSTKPTIAFFGATGGCAMNALALTLKNDYPAVALARTPAKLTKALKEEHSISQETLDSKLTIVAGSVTDIPAVKSVLSHNSPVIINGIGGAPKVALNPIHPFTLDQPTICADGATSIIAALRELNSEGNLATKPLLAVVSTTGISKKRDVPVAFVPLYKWALHVPHVDKEKMESAIVNECDKEDAALRGYTLVRPSLLQDGALKGAKSVKVGWEKHVAEKKRSEDGPGAAVGYFISRADVGSWIFENLVRGQADEWSRKCVSLTY